MWGGGGGGANTLQTFNENVGHFVFIGFIKGLSLSLSVCLLYEKSIYLSFYLSVFCLSIYLFISVCLSVCLCLSQSPPPLSLCLFVSPPPSICLSPPPPSICLSPPPPVYLSLPLPLSPRTSSSRFRGGFRTSAASGERPKFVCVLILQLPKVITLSQNTPQVFPT